MNWLSVSTCDFNDDNRWTCGGGHRGPGMLRVHRSAGGVLRGAIIALAISAFARPLPAIFINPHPNTSGLAQTIADGARPAAGIVGDNSGAGGAFNGSCSGSLTATNLRPGTGYALSAGHCGPIADTAGRFQPLGSSGTVRNSTRVRTHPDNPWGAADGTDLMLMRLPAVTGIAPLELQRTALPNTGADVWEVGFGNTGAGGGFGTKREARFLAAPTATGVGELNRAVISSNGESTDANPKRHSCGGDSGGPYINVANGFQVGVHEAGNPNVCDGRQTDQFFTNVSTPYTYNWIDSYSRRTNFWDHLEVIRFPAGGGGPPVTVTTDTFEVAAADRGQSVLSPGWELGANAMHPTLGLVNGVDPTRYRYINSIGIDNGGTAELFVDGTSAQGVVELAGMPHLVQKTFMVPADPGAPVNVCIRVQQRWNSLGLAADAGLAVPATFSLAWGGLTEATPANLDSWMARGVCNTLPPAIGALAIVAKLLTSTVAVPPAPGDFDGDGDFDGGDVDALVGVIASGTNLMTFDLTGDGLVDPMDLGLWLAAAGSVNLPSGNPYLAGDSNLDGVVDGSDFGNWNSNKDRMLAAWTAGDFTADGVINGLDFDVWDTNKFMDANTISSVPEPSAMSLLWIAAGLAILLRGSLCNRRIVPQCVPTVIVCCALPWVSSFMS